MGQPVMQWQILAKEPAKLADFYTKLFAWDVNYEQRPQLSHGRHLLGARNQRWHLAGAAGRVRAWSAFTSKSTTSVSM